MHPYSNLFCSTGAAQDYDPTRLTAANYMQLQWQPTYIMPSQQQIPQYIQMPFAINPLAANNMQYSPQFAYSQYQNIPTYPTYSMVPIQNQYTTIASSNQNLGQMVNQASLENYSLVNMQSLSSSVPCTPAAVAPIFPAVVENNYESTVISVPNIQLNELSQQTSSSSQQGKFIGKSENTIKIHQTGESKKHSDYEFLSSSSQSLANQKLNQKEQQPNICTSQKSPLLLFTQQTSKQTSEIHINSPISQKILMPENTRHDNSSIDSSQFPKNEVSQQGIRLNQQGSLIFNLSPQEISLLKQLSGINIQNAFKNILKGFTQHVNSHFNHIYIYDYSSAQNSKQDAQNDHSEEQNIQGGGGADTMNVKKIDSPSSQQKKTFIQKFNKFIKNKKYNNTSIKQIIENKLYSTVLKDYIVNSSKEWIRQSTFQNKEDIIVILEFFRMCCENSNLLLFLSKTNDKLIPLTSTVV